MNNNIPTFYFPGLNGLRFIAAFTVIITHIEQLKSVLNLPSYFNPFWANIGSLAVTLFFVLSGFLITYILLNEKNATGNINIFHFYIRRILRIWPLYFFIVSLSLFVLPYISFLAIPPFTEMTLNDFAAKATLLLVILPNIALNLFPPIPYASHTWSIGIEEQFYLVWPLIIKKTKNYLSALYLVIVVLALLSTLSKILAKGSDSQFLIFLNSYFSLLRINCMAIGGIGAYLLHYNKQTILKFIYRRDIQLINIAAIVMILLSKIETDYFYHELFSIFFCVLIVNTAANTKSIVNLENKPLSYLGKISYGLYMYHPLTIVFVIKTLKSIGVDKYFDIYLYPASIILTICLASASYHIFESRFLAKKNAGWCQWGRFGVSVNRDGSH